MTRRSGIQPQRRAISIGLTERRHARQRLLDERLLARLVRTIRGTNRARMCEIATSFPLPLVADPLHQFSSPFVGPLCAHVSPGSP